MEKNEKTEQTNMMFEGLGVFVRSVLAFFFADVKAKEIQLAGYYVAR